MRNFAIATVLFSLACSSVFAADLIFPKLTGRIVDTAHLLDADTAQRLDARLAQQEAATGDQLVVVTLPGLNDVPIEEYGYRLGRAWGIGQKDKDNGAILIVSVADRAVRIEVGYGLEDRLTDAASSLIITRLIVPEFRNGQYAKGIEAGVDAMLGLAGGQENVQTLAARTAPASQAEEKMSPWTILLILVCLFLMFRRSGRRSLAGPLILGSLFGRSGGGGGGFGGFGGGGGGFGGGGASGRW